MKIAIFIILVAIALLIIFTYSISKSDDDSYEKMEVVYLIDLEDSKNVVVHLEESAVKRLSIDTQDVANINGRQKIPYNSLVYGIHGETWIYSEIDDSKYMRISVEVDYIIEDDVYLKRNIPLGTKIVTVGVAELFGAESGVGGKY